MKDLKIHFSKEYWLKLLWIYIFSTPLILCIDIYIVGHLVGMEFVTKNVNMESKIGYAGYFTLIGTPVFFYQFKKTIMYYLESPVSIYLKQDAIHIYHPFKREVTWIKIKNASIKLEYNEEIIELNCGGDVEPVKIKSSKIAHWQAIKPLIIEFIESKGLSN